MLIDVYNKDGQVTGQVELQENVFGVEPNENAMHQAVITYLARKRQGTHKTKIRSEVSGGGRKPWRQKGRGTARAGSTRSPIWVGGGTIHGPKPHKYTPKITKKLSRLARKSALSLRLAEQNMIVVEDFTMEEIKTKQIANILDNLKINGEKTLIMLTDQDNKVYMSGRNIPKLEIQVADLISTYDILSHKKIVLFKGAVDKLQKFLSN